MDSILHILEGTSHKVTVQVKFDKNISREKFSQLLNLSAVHENVISDAHNLLSL